MTARGHVEPPAAPQPTRTMIPCAAMRPAARPARDQRAMPRSLPDGPSASGGFAIPPLQRCVKPMRQLLEAEWLLKDRRVMEVQPGSYIGGVRIGRHEGDSIPELRPPVHDGEGQGEPRYRRQVNVDQDRVHGLTAKERVRAIRLSGREDAIPLGLEDALERSSERGVVIDD